ncbi:carboxypeptidase regulatory-like domain-containing protein [Pedobacter xixiisoli]|nr:carboxypeptidase regulatory-like domain-containing protein [Pedobacter xixiisoli]
MSCSLQKEGLPKIKQGVFGTVTWVEGNMMPSPDAPESAGARTIEREIRIYEALTFKQVKGEAPLFTAVEGKLVKTIKSNAKGFFKCELPVGSYSIFSVESEGKLFANNFDGNGLINAVTVTQGEAVKLDIQINYKAAY